MGIGQAGGRRRPGRLWKTRLAGSYGRAARANRVRLTGPAPRLIATGVAPAAAYGASGGFAPKDLRKLRLLAAKAVVGGGAACSLTTALALFGKPTAERGVRLRSEAIVLTAKLLRKLPEHKRDSLNRARGRALAFFRVWAVRASGSWSKDPRRRPSPTCWISVGAPAIPPLEG